MEEGESHFLAGVLSIALLTLACTPVRAQVLFGSVVGAVTDASGAAVPGATVKITNVQTSNKRTAQTDTGGAYTISTVPAGAPDLSQGNIPSETRAPTFRPSLMELTGASPPWAGLVRSIASILLDGRLMRDTSASERGMVSES